MKHALLIWLPVVAACGGPFGLEDADLPLLRTSADSYLIELDGDRASLVVPYEFTNHTGVSVYVGGCKSAITPVFERRDGDMWVAAYRGFRLNCGANPRVVRSGAHMADTAWAEWWATEDSTRSDRYVHGAVAGRYRLRWDGAATAPFVGGPPAAETLLPAALSVSNEFDVAEASNVTSGPGEIPP